MATCANCGKEIRDDVWTCGFCGTPVSKTTSGAAALMPMAPESWIRRSRSRSW